jgi:hypothetical protein
MTVSKYTVRPELVEGLSCSFEEEGKGFDKLSPNGFLLGNGGLS